MKPVTITINGRNVAIGTATISYQDIVRWCGLEGSPSMTYRFKGGVGGILAPGDVIAVAEGLIINVCHTGNA